MKLVEAEALPKQGHVVFDLTLLDPAALRQEDGLEIAINTLESHLQIPARREPLLRELMGEHHRLGFVLSGRVLEFHPNIQTLTRFVVLSDGISTSLDDWLIETFPSKPKDFNLSLASRMLLHLSRQFWSLSYPRPGLDDCQRAVELALPVLKTIPLMSFPGDELADEIPEELDFGFMVKTKSQRQKKKARRNNRIPFVDTKPFDNLGVDAPTSSLAAEELANGILSDQKELLQVGALLHG